tara:strand:- start:252 stop:959 length:708 start_codon:yes stop_codon:yes gene_type:complete
MANSLLTYVKENPLETALTVASIHPAVRLGKFAFTAGSFAKQKLKRTLLKSITNPVTFFKGRFKQTTGIKRGKRLYKNIPLNEKTYKKYIDSRKYGGKWDAKQNRWVDRGESLKDKQLAREGFKDSTPPEMANYKTYMNMLAETKTSVPTGIRVHKKFRGVRSDNIPPLEQLLYGKKSTRDLYNNQSVHNKSIMARRTSINETVEAHAKRVAEVNKRFQFNKPKSFLSSLLGRKK